MLAVSSRAPWFLMAAPDTTGSIERPHVTAAIDEALRASPVVALTAPAGYGKTTAVAQWAAAATGPVAWLTLTRFDGNRARVAAGVLAALRQAAGLGASEASVPGRAVLLDTARAVTAIGDTVAGIDAVTTLVVDQFECAQDAGDSVLAALAAKPIAGLRLLLVSSDTERTLHDKLGRGGAPAVLGPGTLAFTAADVIEAGALVGERPSAERAGAIVAQTHGWPVAARLALGGSTDSAELGDYVEREILARLTSGQVAVVRATIVAMSFDGPTAEALSGRDDAVRHLEDLVRGGVFLDHVADGAGRRYVWHSIFRDVVLAAELARDPIGTRGRHLVVAELLAPSDPIAALQHALAGGSAERAYDLLLETWLILLLEGHAAELDRAAVALGDPFASRSALLHVRACCAYAAGDLAGARLQLRRATAVAPHAMTEREEFVTVIARILTTDDIETTEPDLARADDLLVSPDVAPGAALAHALFTIGYATLRLRRRHADATALLRAAAREADARGHALLAARAASCLAVSLSFAGSFTEALPHAQRGLGTDVGSPRITFDGGAAECTVGFVAYWRGDLDAARAAFGEMRRLPAGSTVFEPIALVWDALAAAASGETAWQAEAHERLRGLPDRSGMGVSWRELREAALAELALARNRPDEARRHLERVVGSSEFAPAPRAMAAEALRRLGDLDAARATIAGAHVDSLTQPARVQLLLTDALLRHAAGRTDAHIVLERALDAASVEGIRRPFVGLDDDARALLDAHAAWGSRHAAFLGDAISRSVRGGTPVLSPRELEILAYLRTTLTLTEIAAALYLSTNTVKTHVQSLYRKLGVRSRREATTVRL